MKVIVIGAGFAGAATAFVLREQRGADVVVLERAAHPGGMLRTLTTEEGKAEVALNGLWFDDGLT